MISKLNITAGFKNNKTYLKNSFCTSPFKIGNVTEDKTNSLMKLMIMSSSPGVLDNDTYEIDIEVEEAAQLHLTTQAYQRIFNMRNNASQTANVRLSNNSSLWFLPHPVVPHKQSSYRTTNNIYLKAHHELLWSEIITGGRKSCNEEFAFTSYHNTTNIHINDRLVVKENLLLKPGNNNISAIGQMEGFTHQSSLLYVSNKGELNYLMQECRDLLLSIEGIEFGISALPVKGFCIRMLGYKGEQLFETHKRLAVLLSKEVVATAV